MAVRLFGLPLLHDHNFPVPISCLFALKVYPRRAGAGTGIQRLGLADKLDEFFAVTVRVLARGGVGPFHDMLVGGVPLEFGIAQNEPELGDNGSELKISRGFSRDIFGFDRLLD